ncbi:calcium-binding protein [Microvirga yunnanensis]|uniref:calcium-binding protein n=1 Tax=Microvirga yunnanensis TaxID=2953740 RepID=UPI0021C8B71B|nr:calcium-binding protein [Microvirga sp. HBU65207]
MSYVFYTEYKLKPDEIDFSVPEYPNIVEYGTMQELADAIISGAATPYSIHALGNNPNNRIVGSTLGNVLDGGAGQDTLEGAEGNDGLIGGLGADRLIGGNGDDSYNVDDAGDLVIEAGNGGNDFVRSSISYVLPANVENLGLGSGRLVSESYENINGTGNALDNALTGNAGNNHLMGLDGNDWLYDLAGTDTLEGGSGDDSYYISSPTSMVVEAADGGRDTAFLMFPVSDLGAVDFTKLKNVEIIHFSNFSGKYAILEDGEFYILDDTLSPATPTNLDEFQVKDDTIGLSKKIFSKIAKKGDLKNGAFWTGSKAHDKDDRIIYDRKAGDLYYDADGSGSRKAVKFADVDKNLKMSAKDFFVI